MKNYQLTVLICMCMLQNIVYAQKNKINGTYAWDMTEYLTITEDSFKLYLYSTYPSLYGLNFRDTILAEGKVQYESDNFIKLTSKDYEWEIKENMTVIDSIDSHLNDSIRFTFIFPFDGKYKIILYLENHDYKNEIKYELKDSKDVFLPMYKDSILTFSFIILNQVPVEYPFRNYLKNVQFSSFRNTSKNNNSNFFEISIPDLTNSYFNRFLINGEYIRVNKDKDVLFWRNEQYWRVGVFR